MNRNRWWKLLHGTDPLTRPQLRSNARQPRLRKRATFEKLEDRLVLAVALRPGPVIDEVIVSPAANVDEFDVTFGPGIVAGFSGGDSESTIVDLSTISGDDQRYAIPTGPGGPLFRVDTSQNYTLAATGSPRVGEVQSGIFGYQSFDIDQQLVEPIHVAKYAFAADTTLADDLSPGDISFLIADASGWSNEPFNSAETRSLAWYGYTDSTGYTYPDYSYTRNVATDFDDGLWAPGNIWFDNSVGAYRVYLNAPWDGPAIAAGTAVRNATSGPELSEPFPESLVNSPVRWPQLTATIGGEWTDGQRDEFAFRPGTAFIQPYSLVSATIWNDIAFGPDQDFPGAVITTIGKTGTNQAVLDFDVLAKQVVSFTGDYDGNGTVDAADYSYWSDRAGATHIVPFSGADGNGDGNIDELDFLLWRGFFGATPSYSIDSAAATYGAATNVSGPEGDVIHYESDSWFVGTDIVDYTIRDASTGATYSSQISIDVLGSNFEQDAAVVAALEAQAAMGASNTPPKISIDPSYTAGEGETLSDGRLFEPFSDPGDVLVARLLSGTAHGVLSLGFDGTFQYTPVAGFTGVDTFRYEAFDGLNTTTAVASIEVVPLDQLVESRLYEIGLGMLNHESANGRMAVASNSAWFDENGIPYVSWRVHLLRYIGYRSLYDQFHLDEPWDSPNNLPLLDQMPDVYRSLGDAANSTSTRMQTFTGPDAPFGFRAAGSDQIGPKSSEFLDGTKHTVLVVETGPDAAVPWTKPQDVAFDINDPLAAFGPSPASDIQAVMADGNTLKLSASIDPATVKALVTRNGDEVVDAFTLRREYEGSESQLLNGQDRDDYYFQRLALAAHTYEGSKGRFPITGSSYFDEQGNPYLSWRVHILPYLGYQNLFERFHLDEPWDSPNNLPLLAEMPDFFRSANDPADTTTTRVQTFTGPDAPFGYRTLGTDQIGPRPQDILDGFHNTILYVESAAEEAVPWTKPEDLAFDRNDPLAGIDLTQGIRTVFFDTHLESFRPDIPASVFSAFVTRARGEAVSANRFALSDLGPVKSLNQRKNDLKGIILAMHNYESVATRYPVDRTDAGGNRLLSWRVMLLPYLELGSLYSKFHLNEPWDSPHNLSLLQYMPDVYRISGDPVDSVMTSVMHFEGVGAPFPAATDVSQLGPRNQDITDGTFGTITVVDAGPEAAVPWTKPEDLPFYTNNPFSPLGELGEELVAAYFAGNVGTLSSLISPGDLSARITHQGGEDTDVPNEIVTDPGFFVIQTGGDTVTNEFGVDTFYVVLDRAPSSAVVVELNTSDAMVAVLDQSQLTFTPENWGVPQPVAFRGVDNHVLNPDQTVDVTVSVVDALSDPDYHGVPTQLFTAIVIDDDPVAPALPGDYNQDNVINSADYSAWRDAMTAGLATLPNDPTPGTVGEADFLYWRAHYGESLSPGSGSGQSAASSVSQPAVASPPTLQAGGVSTPVLPLSRVAEENAPTVTLQPGGLVANDRTAPKKDLVALLDASPRSASPRSTGAATHVLRSAASDDGASASLRAHALLALLTDRPGRDHLMDAHRAEDWTDVRRRDGRIQNESVSQAESVDAFFRQLVDVELHHAI